jgi:hypothetical protein
LKEHLKENTGKLDSGEFEEFMCEMLLPLGFVEELENLKENSSSILFLLKVKDLYEHLLQKNEVMKSVLGDLIQFSEWQR